MAMDEQAQQQPGDLMALAPTAWSGLQVRSLEQLSDEAFWGYAFNAANPVPHLPAKLDAYLVCQLSSGPWLLPLDALHEIVLTSQLYTHLPATPQWMPGLMAWRGDAIAVINLDAYLCTLQERPYTHSTIHEGSLLIASVDTRTFAFYVGTISETMTIDETQIQSLAVQLPVTDALRPILLGRYAETWILDMRKLINSVMQQING